MFRLIGYEFQKLWTQTAKVCIVAVVLLLSLFLLLFQFDFPDSITNNGKVLHGTRGVRIVTEESKALAGFLDQSYLKKLKGSYGKSRERKIKGNDLPKYIHKYAINSFLNCARKGTDSTNWDLSISWIRSELDFYQRYRVAILKDIKEENVSHWGGTRLEYTPLQKRQIAEKLKNMSTPFHVTSTVTEGLNTFKYDFCQYYWIFLSALVFCLGGIFSRDSNSGLDEMFLASRNGRNRAMKAKQIAGNLFATMLYLIYAAVMAGLCGLAMSFSGLGNSIQFLWPNCVYSFTIGEGILILLLLGWLVALLIANLAMLLSVKIRNLNLSIVTVLALVCFLKWMTQTIQIKRLILNPLYFVLHFISEFDTFYFVGGKMISYTTGSVILVIGAILLITLLMKKSYKTYRIH